MTLARLHHNGIDAVGLDEITTVAELQRRRDRKYVVSIDLANAVLADCGVRVLEIEGVRDFRYESVYFDTPDRICYRAAAHRRRSRFKVRTRCYLDSGLCSLEVKTRRQRGLTEKQRLPYSVLLRRELTAGAIDFISGLGSIAQVSNDLRPSLTTRYSRATLLCMDSRSRVTIDIGLEWEAQDGRCISLPELAIVETKTSGRPSSIDRFLWSRRARPVKISKYGTGLAALTPGLAANKWNRVLRTHFGWTPEPLSRDGSTQPFRAEALITLPALVPESTDACSR